MNSSLRNLFVQSQRRDDIFSIYIALLFLEFFQKRNLSLRDRPSSLAIFPLISQPPDSSGVSDDKGLLVTDLVFEAAAAEDVEAADVGGSRAEAGKFDLSAKGRLLSKGVGALGAWQNQLLMQFSTFRKPKDLFKI